jgi:two-component system sensor histidine kinase DesK
VQRAAWLLVALHVPFVIAPGLFVITRQDPGPVLTAVLVLTCAALGALQLRHSLAAAQGRRPAGWPVTLAAVLALAYGLLPWTGWDWMVSQWIVVASLAMLLRGRLVLVAAVPVVGTAAVAAWTVATADHESFGIVAVQFVYQAVVLAMGGVALVGSARLVRVAGDLDAARAEVAELAVGRERLRVSRDLHDLLGQSLSAVSLKGDLALRLLATDAVAARAEIESLTGVARGALRDVRAVARDEHAVSLAGEIEAAAGLLRAAGIDVRVDVHLPDLAPRLEEVVAWAVREGTTNALRHSDARTCTITAGRRGPTIRLEIDNDGVRAPAGDGGGLAGLAARAHELSGRVTAGADGAGRFRLVVVVPEEAA